MIWLSVISAIFVGVLLSVSLPLGFFALSGILVVWFGLRWIRRERQQFNRVFPDSDECEEPDGGDVPDEPSHRAGEHRAS